MFDIIQNNNNIILLILICCLFLLFCLLLVCLVKIKNLKNKFNEMLGGEQQVSNLEENLKKYYDLVSNLDSEHMLIKKEIEDLNSNLKFCIQKIGIIRYNPFDNMGGDLSYALAMLDYNNNGFVINTIFNRDDSITYCKPIENGISNKYKLSKEEEEAINIAINNKNFILENQEQK